MGDPGKPGGGGGIPISNGGPMLLPARNMLPTDKWKRISRPTIVH